jgi:hypothetical protein
LLQSTLTAAAPSISIAIAIAMAMSSSTAAAEDDDNDADEEEDEEEAMAIALYLSFSLFVSLPLPVCFLRSSSLPALLLLPLHLAGSSSSLYRPHPLEARLQENTDKAELGAVGGAMACLTGQPLLPFSSSSMSFPLSHVFLRPFRLLRV